ncbi:MAG: hypothetical protein ACXW4E_08365 [Anaerolineales bacterium]
MKKEFLPFYISRAILSAAFAILVMGFQWTAILFAIILFGLFLLYLHSGWFSVDLRYPLTPLRRDDHGQAIQRKALIAALIVGMLVYLICPYLPGFLGFTLSGNVALSVGIITYFITQFVLFIRT